MNISEDTPLLKIGDGTMPYGYLALLDQRVAQQPHAPAFHFEQESLTYAEVKQLTLTIAAQLRHLGVNSGDRVVISTARSLYLCPLLLAVWSLRAAYVPVDPRYPAERQQYMLDSAQAHLRIVDHLENTPSDQATTLIALQSVAFTTLKSVELARLLMPTNDQGTDLSPVDYQADDLAYIIYTSGSTGRPKGVPITQGNLLNFLLGMQERPGFTAQDKWLAITTISFDIHVLELFFPLLIGAQVRILTREDALAPQVLQHWIDRDQITVLQATPTSWRLLNTADWRPKIPLAKMLIGGEALPHDLRPWLHSIGLELWNMYGPTETTVWSMCHLIVPTDTRIYIGTPIRNTLLFVVDEQLNPVEKGQIGELLIGGLGVAQGYFLQPELTREKFLQLPHLSDGPLYRTGDAVMRHDQNLLEYINRLDHQIKIRGHRIEPSEIEIQLIKHPDIQQAVVVAHNLTPNDARMLAYYLGTAVPTDELHAYCAQILPAHMVPHHFVWLERFPINANLKIDRKALVSRAAEQFQLKASHGDNPNARDDLDMILMAIWERNLGVSPITLDDNFFELGGHSLLALKVLDEMQKATGWAFSHSAFFETPNLRRLRDHMGDHDNRTASVVHLNKTTEGVPIFCLAGLYIYQHLALQFEHQRPVFGVFAEQEIALMDAHKVGAPIQFNYEALIQAYVDAILRQGHFQQMSLVGLSFGGFVALDVAMALKAQGVQVHRIIMLDSFLNKSTYRSVYKMSLDLIAASWRQNTLQKLARRLFNRITHVFKTSRTHSSTQSSYNSDQLERFLAFSSATSEYEKLNRRYPLDVLLIKAHHTDFGFGMVPLYDYALTHIILGTLSLKSVQANHVQILSASIAPKIHQYICEYESRPI